MNIHLHIDRLVLDGLNLAYADRSQLANAMEAELTRLLGEGGLDANLSGGVNLATLSGASIQFTPSASADQLGAQIAQAVYGGIGSIDAPGSMEAGGAWNNR